MPGTGFWHGVGSGPQECVFFVFFEADDIGFAVLADPRAPEGKVDYLRFTLVSPVVGPVLGWGAPGSA